ncbi:MAG: redox-sensing transcriptional repressor Rex [Deltaproteobacteria bacterium]|jgi:redox-sensing transcriptional repressor|nr:redox-sensing transcriptional repressor Rex [Deltaproteobacteria bacterium]
MIPPKSVHIPRATIQRLAVYLEVLEKLHEDGVTVISSEPLAKACAVNASQIRKDLTYFGEFGVRGVGYNIANLMGSIAEALGADRPWNCVVVGAGKLGRALLNHRDFSQRSYHIIGAFDSDPGKIGDEISGITVRNVDCLKECAAALNAKIGIITTPPTWAQQVADQLVEAGIQGILNFVPARIFVPDHVFLEYVDFFHHLYALSFNITAAESK